MKTNIFAKSYKVKKPNHNKYITTPELYYYY